MKIPVLWVAALSFIAGVVGYVLNEAGQRVATKDAARETAKEAVPSRQEAVRTERPPLFPAPAVATPATTPSRASADEDEPNPSRVSDNMQDYQEYLGLVFDSEGRDRVWEMAAENRLRDGVAKLETLGARVQALDCRASLCKLVLTSSDAATLDAVKARFQDNVPWPGPGMVASVPPTHPNDFRVVVFLGREGRELPDG